MVPELAGFNVGGAAFEVVVDVQLERDGGASMADPRLRLLCVQQRWAKSK